MNRRHLLMSCVLVNSCASYGIGAKALAQNPEWSVMKPSNTGVPGELIHTVDIAPDGRIWVGARWPFWQEGGIGILDRAAGVWTDYQNEETPIPSEYINDVEFEPDGTAWIATHRGLVKFDGQSWTVYDPTNSPLQLYKVTDLSIAPNGHIWVNNSDFNFGGDAIYDFDGVNTWVRYQVPDDLPWPSPWTDLSEVFVASNGHVWVANETLNGVAEFDGNTWTLRGASLGPLEDMAEDQFGNIWMMGNPVGGDYAYFRWNGSSFTRYAFGSPTVLTSDRDTGTIYVGNWYGEVQRTTDGGSTINTYLTGLNQVFAIAPDPQGTDVWIGTIGAVGHFLDDGSWVRDYNSYNSGVPWYWIDNFFTDREGNFWLATGEAGASRYDGAVWRNWGMHNAGTEYWPFLAEQAWGLYQDRYGDIWIGSNGVGRIVDDQPIEIWDWRNTPSFGVTQFRWFAEDMNGTLFTMSEYGATYRFDRDTLTWTKEPVQPYAVLGLPGAQSDSHGNVWIAAWFDIHQWDGVLWSKVTLPYSNYFFDLGGINTMAIGRDDVMWLGTPKGLVRWDGQSFDLYDTNNSPLPYPTVAGVAVRADGLLALSCPGGIGSAAVVTIDGDINNSNSWAIYQYGDVPLPHYDVDCVEFDDNGDLWISAQSEGAAVAHIGSGRSLRLTSSIPGTACDRNTWVVSGATPGEKVHLAYAMNRGSTPVPGCPGIRLDINTSQQLLVGSATADATGLAHVSRTIPCNAQGKQVVFQAVEPATCRTTNVIEQKFQ